MILKTLDTSKISRLKSEVSRFARNALLFFLATLMTIRDRGEYSDLVILVLFILGVLFSLLTLLAKIKPQIYTKNKMLFIYKSLWKKPHAIKIVDIQDVTCVKKEGEKNIALYQFIFFLKNGDTFEYIPKQQNNELCNDIISFLQHHINTLPTHNFPDFPLPPPPEKTLSTIEIAAIILLALVLLALFIWTIYISKTAF